MKFVIKLGGASLENPSTLRGSTQAIVDLVRDGHQVAVVHGGGAALDAHAGTAWKAERICRGPAHYGCRNARCGLDGARWTRQ